MRGILSILNYSFPLIGLFFGQCSEICGVNHGFMPIVIEAVSLEKYLAWLNEQLN